MILICNWLIRRKNYKFLQFCKLENRHPKFFLLVKFLICSIIKICKKKTNLEEKRREKKIKKKYQHNRDVVLSWMRLNDTQKEKKMLASLSRGGLNICKLKVKFWLEWWGGE